MAGFGVLLQEDLENLLKDWTCGGELQSHSSAWTRLDTRSQQCVFCSTSLSWPEKEWTWKGVCGGGECEATATDHDTEANLF